MSPHLAATFAILKLSPGFIPDHWLAAEGLEAKDVATAIAEFLLAGIHTRSANVVIERLQEIR